MSEYAKYSSELQRRLALRSKSITLAEFHRAAFLYLGHRKDVKAINEELKEAAADGAGLRVHRSSDESRRDYWEDSYND